MEPQEKPMTGELYTIGEAADVLGVSIQTLRLYEREGLILSLRRSTRHRRYTPADLERVRCIRRMINVEKVSVAGIKKMLAMIPCWSIKDCPPGVRDACPAFDRVEKPCWLITDKPWDCRNAECRTCEVYTNVADCTSLKQAIATSTTSK
jgi:MerR family transcriptional regulator, heat shock protein HspR